MTTNPNIQQHTQRSGKCVMYGQCGRKSIFAPPLNCAVDLISASPPNPSHRDRLVSVCGSRYKSSNVCCDLAQVKTLDSSIQIAKRFIAACPACWANMQTFWCDFICNPNQARFLNVTESMILKDKLVVTNVDYLVHSDFANGFFDSCKDIKFGPDNRFAMDFIGGGANSPQKFLDFMGAPKPEIGGSPFPIKFPTYDPTLTQFLPLSPPIVHCNTTDSAMRCSCVDCSPVCPILPPFHTRNQGLTLPAIPVCSFGTYSCLDIGGMALTTLILVLWTLSISICALYRYIQPKRNAYQSVSTSENTFPQSGLQSLPAAPATTLTSGHVDSVNETSPLLGTSSDTDNLENGDPHVIDVDGYPIRVHVLHSFQPKGPEALFMKIGWYATEYPISAIVCALLITLICISGWWVNNGLTIMTDPIDLWIPPHSPELAAKLEFDKHFGPFFRTQQIIVRSNITFPDPLVLGEDVFRDLFALQTKLTMSGTADGIKLADVCSHPLPNVPPPNGCIVQSVTGYWQNSEEVFARSDWRKHLASCLNNPAQTKCLPPYGQPIKPSMVIDLNTPSASSGPEPIALIVTFVNQNIDASTSNAKHLMTHALSWERWFRSQLDEESHKWAFNGMQLTYSTESSIETEVTRATSADGWIILISYIAMIAYIITTLRSPAVGFMAVLLVVLSLCMAVGLMAWLSIPASFILLEVLPFLALAIGVDNVFLLVEALHAVKVFPSSKVRVAIALSRQGPGFLISFACEVLVFLTASLINIPAVSTFALYAAATVTCLFFLQCTLFVSILSNIHVPSIKHSTNLWSKYVMWLIAHKWALLATIVGITTSAILMLTNVQLGLDQRDALPQDSHLSPYFDAFDRHFHVGPPLYYMVGNIDVQSNSVLTNFTNLCGRFADCRNVSIPNILEQERKRSRLSYIASPATAWLDDFVYWLQPFPDWDASNPASCCSWRRDLPPLNTFCDPSTNSISQCTSCVPSHQWNPTSMQQTLQSIRTILPNLIDHWLNSVPSADCPQAGAAYRDTVSRNLTAFAFRTQSVVLSNQTALIQGKFAHEQVANEISDMIGQKVSVYSVFHPFFAQYTDLEFTTGKLIGFALFLVCILAYMLLSSLRHAIILVLAMGIMQIWVSGMALGMAGIPLNGVSVVNLVMATGLGVEFCIHVLRAYVTPTAGHGAQYLGPSARSRPERVRQALLGAGAAVLSGIGWTKLVGVLVLAFAQSTIFRKYYFFLYLYILISGLIVGLLVLPLLLLFFGSEDKSHVSSPADNDLDDQQFLTPPASVPRIPSVVHESHLPIDISRIDDENMATPKPNGLSVLKNSDTRNRKAEFPHGEVATSSADPATRSHDDMRITNSSGSTIQPISISFSKHAMPSGNKVKFEVGSLQGTIGSVNSTFE